MLRIAGIWILMVSLLCINNAAIADEINDECFVQLSEKFYINNDQITFIEDKIYIQVEEYVYETPAVHSDKYGYYIDKVAKSGHCAWYEWECVWKPCSYCNLRGIDLKCRACTRDMLIVTHMS